MEPTLFLREVLCECGKAPQYQNLNLAGAGKSFVIATRDEFWIVKAETLFDAVNKLVAHNWSNTLYEYRIHGCSWKDYQFIGAELAHPMPEYHGGNDADYLRSLDTIEGSEDVFVVAEYLDPEDANWYPSMPV